MFSGVLQEILDAELAAGNIVQEEWSGNWPFEHCRCVLLKMPFKTPINYEISGVKFRNVNDPHYWKAEYYDETRIEVLACAFGGAPDFSKMD